jgi:hypothetical protein
MARLTASAAIPVGENSGSFGQVTVIAVSVKNRADGPRMMTPLTTVSLHIPHLIVCHQVRRIIIVVTFHASNGSEIDRFVRWMATAAGVGPDLLADFVAALACMALYGF